MNLVLRINTETRDYMCVTDKYNSIYECSTAIWDAIEAGRPLLIELSTSGKLHLPPEIARNSTILIDESINN